MNVTDWKKKEGGKGRKTKKTDRERGVEGSSTFNDRITQPYFPASRAVKISMCISKHLHTLHLSLTRSRPPRLCPITHQSLAIKQINWLDILISLVFDLVEYITDVYIGRVIILSFFIETELLYFHLPNAEAANRLKYMHTNMHAQTSPPNTQHPFLSRSEHPPPLSALGGQQRKG